MKRKQFLNRLMKISEMHQSLNPIHDIALISNKMNQSKEIPEPMIKRIVPIQTANNYWQQSSIKNREIVVIKSDLVTSKVLIHAKGNITSCRKIPSRRRMKTTPTHSKLNYTTEGEDLSKLLKDNRSSDYLDDSPGHRSHYATDHYIPSPVPHYLQIRELQPKAITRKFNNTRPLKQAAQEIHRYSKMKKHSLTEQSQNFNKESHTERKLQLQSNKFDIDSQKNSSIRAGSFKKYCSLADPTSNNQKIDHNRLKLSVRKEINKNYTKHFVPPPKLTAKSYIIYQVKERRDQSKVVVAFNSKNSQQVASLTKIMTCILSLEICQQFSINKQHQEVSIGKMQSNVGGTTASLAHGQIYTIQQLLLGLMLPSGNDASMALAIWGGKKLLEVEPQHKSNNAQQKHNGKFTKMECYNRFICQMNVKAKEIGMTKTNYANSHGLMNPNNKSCAYDIALLCDYAMRNQLFRAIVSCRNYKGTIRYSQHSKKMENKLFRTQNQDGQSTDISQNQQKSPLKQLSLFPHKVQADKNISVQWQNTHKLLQIKPKEYLGIKTGFTQTAGPCLSSYLSISNRNFIIIVLGCGRVNLRFKETEILRKWLVKHENLRKKKTKSNIRQMAIEHQQQQQLQEQEMQFLLEAMKVDEERED